MRHADRLLKTMCAVRRFIDHCRRESAPLDALDQCLGQLRSDPNWDESEIAEVEAAARKAIEAACRDKPLVGGQKPTTMADPRFYSQQT